ncbi:MAG: aminopeptidase P family N-terminal domain-containing protein, partial [Alphaproteobacteria bacterium]|nr:aminopeptidase P family N-terminal domain-containing protein [Alphaproteobacteria bacterium]
MTIQNSSIITPEKYAKRLKAVRTMLREYAVQGFVIPVADEYQGEYPPASARRVTWLCGFTGSAGAAVVLEKNAAIFVDGRYTLQVRQQVDMAHYEPKDLVSDPVAEWVAEKLPKGAKFAYDPWMHTQSAVEAMQKSFDKHGITLVALDQNLLDAAWTE